MGRSLSGLDGRSIGGKRRRWLQSIAVFAIFYKGSFTETSHREEFMQLDDTDRRILRQLLADPAAPRTALADRAGVTGATLARRLDRLRDARILRATGARIDWRALGYTVEVSLRFTLDKTNPRAFDEFIAAARLVPEVIGIETFLGRVDVRLTVIARDMAQYQDIYRARILTLPHIAELEALMLVATIKDTAELPL
jgi:Lrp/AsnC family transcriptional regulator